MPATGEQHKPTTFPPPLRPRIVTVHCDDLSCTAAVSSTDVAAAIEAMAAHRRDAHPAAVPA